MADKRTVDDILKAIRDFHASPRESLAAELTPIVESGVRPLSGGDRDSTGAYQQRPSQGWGPAGESTYKDALQFLQHARTLSKRGFKGSAGQLAQAVQRSATPGAYDKVRGQASSIFGGATPVASASSTSNSAGGKLDPSVPDLSAILGQLGGGRSAVPVTGPQAPGFAARPTLPSGYVPPAAAPKVADTAAPASLGDLAAQVVQSVDTSTPESAPTAASPGASGPATRSGKITIAPGANAPGRPLTKGLEKILGELGDVTVGTGTNHSYMTTSGNVSDHVSGNAADLPARGDALTTKLDGALQTYAVGKTVTWMQNGGKTVQVKVTAQNAAKLAAAGGLFNIPYGEKRRIQVIGNSHIGGDHTNHVHVGLSPVR